MIDSNQRARRMMRMETVGKTVKTTGMRIVITKTRPKDLLNHRYPPFRSLDGLHLFSHPKYRLCSPRRLSRLHSQRLLCSIRHLGHLERAHLVRTTSAWIEVQARSVGRVLLGPYTEEKLHPVWVFQLQLLRLESLQH